MNCECLQLINADLVQGTSATAIVAQTSLENQSIYKLRYCIKWTDATGTEPLNIQVGPTGGTPAPVTYPVLSRNGEPATIGQIRRRELLCLRFVNPNTTPVVVPPHFVVLNDLCSQMVVTPEVTA